jgi:predicted enzyme related to lactoylglutathione lyase
MRSLNPISSKEDAMKSAIDWFEIPSKDFSRAMKFYNTILGEPLKDMSANFNGSYAFFPMEFPGIGGALTSEACTEGHLNIYLNAGDDLNRALDKVKSAGGEILMPKTAIGEYGFIAFIKDTEGNRIGLHSMH